MSGVTPASHAAAGLLLVTLLAPGVVTADGSAPSRPAPSDAARFTALALACIGREYPNKLTHVLDGPEDARTPAELHPIFYGCLDWHSAVHGHWMLVRWLRLDPPDLDAARIEAALERSFDARRVAGELEYFSPDRRSFERPYGLAWFLQLMTELRAWDDPRARRWAERLAPLEREVVARFVRWLPDLVYPVRSGTHDQTAFALGLALDWARTANDASVETLLTGTAHRLYGTDRRCPLRYEPSGEDFLSPCLMEADLMRRVLPAREYARWLTRFLPEIPTTGGDAWLTPGVVRDRTDGKLMHLDGLNLSRAWALRSVAVSLPPRDSRRAALDAAAIRHADDGLREVSGEHYAGGHWLASFATYWVTRSGSPAP